MATTNGNKNKQTNTGFAVGSWRPFESASGHYGCAWQRGELHLPPHASHLPPDTCCLHARGVFRRSPSATKCNYQIHIGHFGAQHDIELQWAGEHFNEYFQAARRLFRVSKHVKCTKNTVAAVEHYAKTLLAAVAMRTTSAAAEAEAVSAAVTRKPKNAQVKKG